MVRGAGSTAIGMVIGALLLIVITTPIAFYRHAAEQNFEMYKASQVEVEGLVDELRSVRNEAKMSEAVALEAIEHIKVLQRNEEVLVYYITEYETALANCENY